VLGVGDEPASSVQLVFKYGPHGGRHGHPDKLSLALWGFGQPVSQDLGTGGYGDVEGTSWYRSTLAHNTVEVDGEPQPPATGHLRQYRGSEDGGFGVADAEVEWREGAYRGVRIRRVLLHRFDTVIDIVDCQADAPRTFQLAQRFRGHLGADGEPADRGGVLRNLRALAPPEDRRLEVTVSPSLHVDYFALEPGSQWLVGEAPANPRTSFDAIVLRRRSGSSSARFVSIIHLRPNGSPRVRAKLLEGGASALTIGLSSGKSSEIWRISCDPRLDVEVTGYTRKRFLGLRQPLLAFLPGGHGSREYVGLLRAELERIGVQVGDLPRVLTPEWLRAHAGPSTVLHLHMPAYDYSKGASGREEVLERLPRWEEGIELARFLGLALVWTAHNLYPHDAFALDLHHRARLTLLKNASAIIVHCRGAIEEIRRHFGDPPGVTVIPHPHYGNAYPAPGPRGEARAELGLPRDAVVYLNLGMIRPYKGQVELIRAFSALDDPQARLVIAGSASDGLVDRLRAAAGGDSRILLRPDRVPDSLIPTYYAASDFAVFAYRQILTSGGVRLAQTMERPVIAPSLGCLPEMVPAGTGMLYDPADERGLETALRRARSLPPAAGKQAWESVRSLDWRAAALATREVYRRAVGDGARSQPGAGG
jgi:beta-1,4-mannosyltransferase